jgi:BNR repeat-like domain
MHLLFLTLWLLQAFTYNPVEANMSAPVRISNNPDQDEDPSAVLAQDGRFYVVWASKRNSGVHLFIKSSEDGQTWQNEERITYGRSENYYPSLIQSKNGTFHLAWFQLDKSQKDMDIWYSRSKDARTWTEPVQISHNPGPDWAPVIHEDSHGILRIVWSSSQTQNRELFVTESRDGGQSWSSERQITNSPEEDDFPQMIETKNGELILAWTRYAKGSRLFSYTKDASAELVMARSMDGVHWSAAEVCSPPDEKQRYLDLLPFIFEDSGRQHLYISWTSSRTGRLGDILMRDLSMEANSIVRLTIEDKADYDAKIVRTRDPGRYLMVWVSNREGKTDIYSRTFRWN